MADYITTYSKIHFTPLEPNEEDILIDDIAHALSLITRANGHFSQFYSVAQHCIACCEEALARKYSKKVALGCLLHDGSEAYIGDITRPLKKNLAKYLEIEEVLQGVIYNKYIGSDFTEDEVAQIVSVDDTLLFYEFKHFAGEELQLTKEELMSNPVFETLEFSKVEDKFKDLFNKLIVNN